MSPPRCVRCARWGLALLAAVLCTACTSSKAKREPIFAMDGDLKKLEGEMLAQGAKFIGGGADDQGIGYFVHLRRPGEGYAILWKSDPSKTLEPSISTVLLIDGRRIAPADDRPAVYALRANYELEELPVDPQQRAALLHLLVERNRTEKGKAPWPEGALATRELSGLSQVSGKRKPKLSSKGYVWRIDHKHFDAPDSGITQVAGQESKEPAAAEPAAAAAFPDKAMYSAIAQMQADIMEVNTELLKSRLKPFGESLKPLQREMEALGGSVSLTSRDSDVGYFLRQFPDKPGYAILWKVDEMRMIRPEPATALVIDKRRIEPPGPGLYALRADLQLEAIDCDAATAQAVLERMLVRAGEKTRVEWSKEPFYDAVFPQLEVVTGRQDTKEERILKIAGKGDQSLRVLMQPHESWRFGPAFKKPDGSDGANCEFQIACTYDLLKK